MTEHDNTARDVAMAALTNLIRLMGAELVAGRHRDDPALIERCVRSKLAATMFHDCSPEAVAGGLALATAHVNRALAQIYAQARAARLDDLSSVSARAHPVPVVPTLH